MNALGSGAMKLMVGKVVSIGIAFAAAPLIGRLFAPERYGVVSLLESLVMWLAAFSCLGYAHAVPLATSTGEIKQLARLCMLLTGLLMLPVLAVTLFSGGFLARVLKEPVLQRFIWYLPLLFLLASLLQICQYVLAKQGKYGVLSLMNFSTSGAAKILQAVFGLAFGGTALCLLWASIAGNTLAVFVAASALVAVLAGRRRGESLPAMAEVARRHRQFPRFQLWSSVLNTTSLTLPVMLMGSFFGTEVVGYYGMGNRMITLPLTVLGASVAQVFYPEAAEEWNRTGSIAASINSTIHLLSVTCIFPIVCVALLGPVLFRVLLGNDWEEAGVYAQILSPWILVVLVSSPTSSVFLIRERSDLSLIYTLVQAITRPAALLVGAAFASPRIGIMSFSCVGFIILAHKLNVTIKLGLAHRRTAASMMLRETCYSCLALLPSAIAFWAGSGPVVVIALLAMGSVAHAFALYRREPAIRLNVQNLLRRLRPWVPRPEP